MTCARRMVFFLTFFLLPGGALAAERLTLTAAIQRALAANPELAAKTEETAAARARPAQLATPPDPNLMFEVADVPTATTDISQGMRTTMVEQQIPFPTKLISGYRAERHAAQAAELRQVAATQELVREVTAAYLHLYRLRAERMIEARAFSFFQAEQTTAEKAYAAGEQSIADPARAAVDASAAAARLIVIDQDLAQAVAALSQLVNESLATDIELSPPPEPTPPPALATLIARAQTSRPEVAEAEKLIEEGRARTNLARSQFGPDLTFRFGITERPNAESAWTGRIMASIPLWSLSKQRLAVKESKAKLHRAEAMHTATLLATETEIRSAYARFAAAAKLVTLYQGVVPRAAAALTASEAAYRSGAMSLQGVVDSIRGWREAAMTLVRAQTDRAEAAADIERAVGGNTLREGSS